MKKLGLGAFGFNAGSRSLLLLAATAVSGCQETVSFNVVRAAKVNVPGMTPEGKDATVAIGAWDGVDASAAGDIAQRIREIITAAPGGVVKFSESNGIVRLDGALREYQHEERVTQEASTCSRYDESTKKSVEYSCTIFKREGSARITASMNVIDATGKTVGADSFAQTVPKSTSATDQQPPAIDWASVLAELRASAAVKLASLVVPTPVQIDKPWFECGDANDHCEAGLVQLRQGNFDTSQHLFREAIDLLSASTSPDAEALAAAWWALTLSQEFSGDYAGATASLNEAIRHDPTNEHYAAEGSSIRDLKDNAEKLHKQGAVGD